MHPREASTTTTSAIRHDPRVSHAITLEVDRVWQRRCKSGRHRVRAACSRTALSPADQVSKPALVTYAKTDFTEPVDNREQQTTVRRCRARREPYELTGFAPVARAADSVSICERRTTSRTSGMPARSNTREAAGRGVKQKRAHRARPHPLSRERSDWSASAGGARIARLPRESYKLAFTPGLLTASFVVMSTTGSLKRWPDRGGVLGGKGQGHGGYVDLDPNGHWWIPSGQVFYSPDRELSIGSTSAVSPSRLRAHFFLPRTVRRSLRQARHGRSTTAHHLLVVTTADAFGN